jgi:hypothetical protein
MNNATYSGFFDNTLFLLVIFLPISLVLGGALAGATLAALA